MPSRSSRRIFAHDPERLRRAERKARVLASLNHPNIATLFGIEDGDGLTGLVLEFVPGRTLRQHLAERGPLPPDEALVIAWQIAAALEAAHQHGIVHRDLKPANIAITPDGIVKVLDVGLARVEGGDAGSQRAAGVTGTGTILGTVAYMSPGQARGQTADRRTDIWAFGAVLFEMPTGERAFDGDSIVDTVAAVLRGDAWLDRPARGDARACSCNHRAVFGWTCAIVRATSQTFGWLSTARSAGRRWPASRTRIAVRGLRIECAGRRRPLVRQSADWRARVDARHTDSGRRTSRSLPPCGWGSGDLSRRFSGRGQGESSERRPRSGNHTRDTSISA